MSRDTKQKPAKKQRKPAFDYDNDVDPGEQRHLDLMERHMPPPEFPAMIRAVLRGDLPPLPYKMGWWGSDHHILSKIHWAVLHLREGQGKSESHQEARRIIERAERIAVATETGGSWFNLLSAAFVDPQTKPEGMAEDSGHLAWGNAAKIQDARRIAEERIKKGEPFDAVAEIIGKKYDAVSLRTIRERWLKGMNPRGRGRPPAGK